MEKFRAREVFSNSACSVIAVELASLQSSTLGRSRHLFGQIQPVALFICDKQKLQALDMTATPIGVGPVLAKTPDIDALLSTCARRLRASWHEDESNNEAK